MESEVEMSVLKSHCFACSQQAQHGKDGVVVRTWGNWVTLCLRLGSRGRWVLILSPGRSPGNGAASVHQAWCSCLEMYVLSDSWLCHLDSINSHFQVVISPRFQCLVAVYTLFLHVYRESTWSVSPGPSQCFTDVVCVVVGMKRAYNRITSGFFKYYTRSGTWTSTHSHCPWQHFKQSYF